ncbi:MAG TPA: acetate kinase [Chloroflexia bacterium]|nr:acetate kinase [Chloroflexia bacterium]
MKVLVLNTGSSTLKFDVVDTGVPGDTVAPRKLVRGRIERIGQEGCTLEIQSPGGTPTSRSVDVRDYGDAVAHVLSSLGSWREQIEAVGHRVVHGGDQLVSPTLLDSATLLVLESVSELAPLHNPPAIQAIRAAREAVGSDVPMVAVFDTAFHSAMPEHASMYALPYELSMRHKVKRYGFHGIAHEYMLKRYAQLAGVHLNEVTIITLQLGNGCSAAAIRDGRSVDTSMGFTPLEGLVMGTRSGDLDPSLVAYLAEREGVPVEEVETLLNKRSGLLGISGRSSDMRDLLSVMEDDERASLAVDIFCYRARKYIGAYMAALGGAQAVVFGGGIGENSPAIRARICEGLEWCGLRLDPERNDATIGDEGRVSVNNASIDAYVVAVDESILIAEHTADLLR